MSDVFAEVASTLGPMAAYAHVVIDVAPVHAELPRVFADRTRLAQILMNFGSSAIKYGRPSGRARFEATKGGGEVRITVTDDGIGIPADKRDKLFEPFQRAGQETGPIEGIGIGLAISKRLAGMMNGRVGFTSEAGCGSRFWVRSPRIVKSSRPLSLHLGRPSRRRRLPPRALATRLSMSRTIRRTSHSCASSSQISRASRC